jgi:hypothetical protein
MAVAKSRSWRWRIPLLVLLALLLGATFLALGGFDTAILDLLPPVALVALMLAWPYPGTELIVRLAKRRRRRPGAVLAPRLRPPRRLPRGGCLISLSLGGRAPPAFAGRA